MWGAFLLPISLFWFGWSSQYAPQVHWIVPIIATGFYSLGVFGLFQAGLK
jgi:DHA1 family multidrug resistance protein-like MFS transporter